MTLGKEKPEIIYPCQWTYSVMGQDEEDLRLCIGEVLLGRKHSVVFARQSTGKKYTAMHVDVWVVDEADRNSLFEAFRDHPKVKFVL
jgi:putative lipoic acid-binding regulatory protein